MTPPNTVDAERLRALSIEAALSEMQAAFSASPIHVRPAEALAWYQAALTTVATLRGMIGMLEANEWANTLSRDPLLAQLDAAISTSLAARAEPQGKAERVEWYTDERSMRIARERGECLLTWPASAKEDGDIPVFVATPPTEGKAERVEHWCVNCAGVAPETCLFATPPTGEDTAATTVGEDVVIDRMAMALCRRDRCTHRCDHHKQQARAAYIAQRPAAPREGVRGSGEAVAWSARGPNGELSKLGWMSLQSRPRPDDLVLQDGWRVVYAYEDTRSEDARDG